MVPIQPDSMEEQGHSKVPQSSSDFSSSMPKKAEEPKRAKRRRLPVPDDRKDGKYWERRHKNNVAAKRSRETRRLKQEQDLLKAEHAIQENIRLRAEVDVLKSEISSLRRLLKDANTTLSLWIKARQATEPVHQLPPSLRDKNGPLSFVNFPMWSKIEIKFLPSYVFLDPLIMLLSSLSCLYLLTYSWVANFLSCDIINFANRKLNVHWSYGITRRRWHFSFSEVVVHQSVWQHSLCREVVPFSLYNNSYTYTHVCTLNDGSGYVCMQGVIW